MKMLHFSVALVLSCWLAACNKSDSSTSKSDAGAETSAASARLDEEAKAAALAEIGRHWVQTPDGWITAKAIGTSFAPERFLRQIKQITVAGVGGDELSESDKLNGFEWSGAMTFAPSPCREVGDQGFVLEGIANVTVSRRRGQWSQWVDFAPESLRLQKVKGQWQIPQDTWMLRGKLPTAADMANAGVK